MGRKRSAAATNTANGLTGGATSTTSALSRPPTTALATEQASLLTTDSNPSTNMMNRSQSKESSSGGVLAKTASNTCEDEIPKIDPSSLYDINEVKNLLDERIKHVLQGKGYEESTATVKIKIVLCFVSLIVALYAHNYAVPFEKSKDILRVCITIFAVCNLGIIAVDHVLEGSAAFTVFPNMKRMSIIPKLAILPKVIVDSFIDREDAKYHIHLRVPNKKGASKEVPAVTSTSSQSSSSSLLSASSSNSVSSEHTLDYNTIIYDDGTLMVDKFDTILMGMIVGLEEKFKKGSKAQ